MTLQEAIKGGKRFRRKGQTYYLELFHGNNTPLYLNAGDIAADDWEVEATQRTITETSFESACDQVKKNLHNKFMRDAVHIDDFLAELKKELEL